MAKEDKVQSGKNRTTLRFNPVTAWPFPTRTPPSVAYQRRWRRMRSTASARRSTGLAGKAQVRPGGIVAEIETVRYGDARRLEQIERETLAIVGQRAAVGVDVERALRLCADAQAELLKFG